MRDASQVAAMPCPVCRTPLALSDRRGIEIDFCPNCRGVWLDRGELDKIIERSAAEFSAPAPQRMAEPMPHQPQPAPQRERERERERPQRGYGFGGEGGEGHEGGEGGEGYYRGGSHPKRKKSWLSEIFD